MRTRMPIPTNGLICSKLLLSHAAAHSPAPLTMKRQPIAFHDS